MSQFELCFENVSRVRGLYARGGRVGHGRSCDANRRRHRRRRRRRPGRGLERSARSSGDSGESLERLVTLFRILAVQTRSKGLCADTRDVLHETIDRGF